MSRAAVAEYARNVKAFLDEDNTICRRQQIGLRSRRGAPGRFCKHESLTRRFDQWVAERAYGPVPERLEGDARSSPSNALNGRAPADVRRRRLRRLGRPGDGAHLRAGHAGIPRPVAAASRRCSPWRRSRPGQGDWPHPSLELPAVGPRLTRHDAWRPGRRGRRRGGPAAGRRRGAARQSRGTGGRARRRRRRASADQPRAVARRLPAAALQPRRRRLRRLQPLCDRLLSRGSAAPRRGAPAARQRAALVRAGGGRAARRGLGACRQPVPRGSDRPRRPPVRPAVGGAAGRRPAAAASPVVLRPRVEPGPPARLPARRPACSTATRGCGSGSSAGESERSASDLARSITPGGRRATTTSGRGCSRSRAPPSSTPDATAPTGMLWASDFPLRGSLRQELERSRQLLGAGADSALVTAPRRFLGRRGAASGGRRDGRGTAPPDRGSRRGPAAREPPRRRSAPTRAPSSRVVSVVMFVDTMLFAVIAPLLPGLAGELHLSKLSAGVLTASYPIGMLVAALPCGVLAARVGPRPHAVRRPRAALGLDRGLRVPALGGGARSRPRRGGRRRGVLLGRRDGVDRRRDAGGAPRRTDGLRHRRRDRGLAVRAGGRDRRRRDRTGAAVRRARAGDARVDRAA